MFLGSWTQCLRLRSCPGAAEEDTQQRVIY
jgi:hypothetical protein